MNKSQYKTHIMRMGGSSHYCGKMKALFVKHVESKNWLDTLVKMFPPTGFSIIIQEEI